MKVKKGMKRVIAMLLVIATVGTGSGISTMAESTKAKNEKGKTTEKTQKEQALSPDEVAQQIADGTYKGRKLKETKYYDTYEAAVAQSLQHIIVVLSVMKMKMVNCRSMILI